MLGLPIVFSNCGNEYWKIFKKEESIKLLKILGLSTNIEESQKIYNGDFLKQFLRQYRLKNIDETKKYFIEEMIKI